MTQIEFGFCPRDADVEQTALFLKVGRFGFAPGQRENAVFTANDKDNGKFQTFGGMEGE